MSALAGGILIGISASLLLLVNGRVAGISGMIGGLLTPRSGEVGWRAAFLLGLMLSAVAFAAVAPHTFTQPERGLLLVVAAGVLVGVGTRLGNGCTSGHGVCGLSRFSRRSLVASATFIASGVLTVFLSRLIGGQG